MLQIPWWLGIYWNCYEKVPWWDPPCWCSGPQHQGSSRHCPWIQGNLRRSPDRWTPLRARSVRPNRTWKADFSGWKYSAQLQNDSAQMVCSVMLGQFQIPAFPSFFSSLMVRKKNLTQSAWKKNGQVSERKELLKPNLMWWWRRWGKVQRAGDTRRWRRQWQHIHFWLRGASRR
jgi:hypothetical protein